MQIFKALKSSLILSLFTLTSVLVLLSGCDNSSEDFVFTNTNNNGNAGQINGFDLEVGFDPAALARGTDIRAQISADVTQFRATLIDSNNATIDQQTTGRAQTVTFRGLAPGSYLVRFEGLDAGGATVGYFDRIFTITNSRVTSLLPGLIPDTTPPAASFTTTQSATTPFFVFTSVPTTAQGITGFNVSAQVFDAQGNPTTAATTGVSLTSSNLNFDSPVANQDTAADGTITFSAVRFEEMATGTATLTIDATGVDSATSGDIAVTPPGDFFATLELVSQSTAGDIGDDLVFDGAISGDGNVVAFGSRATNMIPVDGNFEVDIFLRDRQANTTTAASVNPSGAVGNNGSFEPAVSADGRFVAFYSGADDLVPNDNNNDDDIFVYDRQTGTTEIVSILSDGTQGNGFCFFPAISDDGQVVVFLSSADNFDLPPTNNRTDIFAYDRQTDTLERISLPGTFGHESRPAISGDGRYIAFQSPNNEGIASDTNGSNDIFVYDRTTDTVALASTDANGDQGNAFSFDPDINTDGSLVVFTSRNRFGFTPDNNGALRDVYVKNMQTGAIERVSENDAGDNGDGDSFVPFISGDGRFVGFSSDSTDLVPGDMNGVLDAFVFDRNTQTIQRVSVDSTGAEIPSQSAMAGFSSDGSTILFNNTQDGLASGDNNGFRDFFTIANPSRR